MAKNTIADLDTTASNNTDVLGQSTQGSAAVSTLDTIIQNLMGVIARFYTDLGGEGTVGGSANAITYTSASTYQALEDGLIISLKAGSSNSGTTTLNVDSLGVLAVRLSGDTALSGGEILAGGIYTFRYESSYNSSAGAWVLLNPSISAATTSLAGKVELATAAEASTGTSTSLAVTPAGLYFPTGHLYGLTLSNNASDATNDIDIAAGTARDASDSVNMVLASTLTKRGDASWAVGTGNGGMDTGSIADGTNYIWLIKRSDTGVVDGLISASGSSPTMPTNYDYKLLIGYFVRASSTNGAPVWYGPVGERVIHVRDEKSSGTNGGDFTSGAWQTRTLNTTVTNTIIGASVASNQITLPAGVYEIEATAPGFQVTTHAAKLRNTTDGSDVIIGTVAHSGNGGNYAVSFSVVRGRFILSASKVLELQHRCTTTRAGDGFGQGGSFSVNNVFAEVMIRKIA